jgi:hypothetical protein
MVPILAACRGAPKARESPLLRIVLTRALLVALPFAVYFLWAAWAKRSGRTMGATPWGWLTAAGCVLVGLSLMATVVFHSDNREGYVPAQAHPGGKVTPGGFDPSRRSPPVNPQSPNTAP